MIIRDARLIDFKMEQQDGYAVPGDTWERQRQEDGTRGRDRGREARTEGKRRSRIRRRDEKSNFSLNIKRQHNQNTLGSYFEVI